MVEAARSRKAELVHDVADPRRERMETLHLLSALQSISEGFALFDADDRLVLHNRRFLDLFPFLGTLGDLHGLTFSALISVPSGEWAWAQDRDSYVAERMRRHVAADGTPFNIPLENGGWVQVRERRTCAGWIVGTWSAIRELKEGEQKLLDALESLGEGFVLLDAQERILLANSCIREMFGAAHTELRPGRTLDEVLGEAAANGFFAQGEETVSALFAELRQDSPRRVEVALRSGGWMLASHRPMGNGCTVGVWTEVTAQKRREAELIAMREQLRLQTEAQAEFAALMARQARQDMLTGLPNRFALEERLGQLLRDSDTHGIWIAFIDLDHFKSINDKVGYAAADELLRGVGQFLRAHVRGDDMVARIGGDEFAILLTGLEEPEVLRIARRLAASAHEHSFWAAGRSFSIGLSIGLARSNASLRAESSLLAAADTACYVAKDAGRNRVQLYDLGDPKVSDTRQRLGWAERIQLALDTDRFNLHLQAIVDTERAVLGYEALIRLVDDDGTAFHPGHFLPAARRLGLMGRIDTWVCRKAVGLAQRLIARGTGQYVSMNIGAQSLADPGFQRSFTDLLDLNPGVERALRIELTETEEIADVGPLSAFLALLRTRGLHIYLDDFGNGYNSFEVLKRLKVDGIKIDWTVTRDILQDPIDEALMKAAISIAQSLGLELVAEGVEKEGQLAKLRELGALHFQGFHFHQPMDAETVLHREPTH